MRKMPRSLLLSLLVAPLWAQTPQQRLDTMLLPEIEQLLASDTAADVAWGGYLVHQYRLRRAQRAVCEALARWRELGDDEARVVRLHLLDGLLGSGALIPADQVESLLADPLTRDGAFSLMAQQPHSSSEQLERIANAPAPEGDLARLGAARVLFAAGVRMDELTRSLVTGFVPELVVVVGRDREEGGLGFFAVDLGIGNGMARRHAFPPLISLRLANANEVETLERTVAPAVADQQPLVLVRKESVQYGAAELTFGELVGWSNRERRIMLQAMSGVVVDERVEVAHEYRDAKTFLDAVVPLRDAQQRACDELLAAIRDRRLTGAEALAGHRIRVAVRIDDHRAGGAARLPELPPPSAQDR